VESLWQEFRPRTFDRIRENLNVSALVVGGGLAGLATALELGRGGRKVAVLEESRIGGGASGRNGGFLLTGAAEDFLVLKREAGLATARLMEALSRENRRKVKVLEERSGLSFDIGATGSYILSVDEDERAHLKAVGAAMREAGYDIRETTPKEAGTHLEEAGYLGGLFVPEDGQIHPQKLIFGLADEARGSGVRIFEASPVTEIRRETGEWTATTPSGTVRAQVAVLALNAYLPRLYPPAEAWIHPVRGQVLATDPVPQGTLNGPIYAQWGFRYFRQLPDGGLIVGGFRDTEITDEVGWELVLNERVQRRLDEEAERLAPGARARKRWSGIMGMTPDHLPVVGEVDEGLWVIGGFSGHGVALAPVLGEHLAHMIEGVRQPYPPLSPARFEGRQGT